MGAVFVVPLGACTWGKRLRDWGWGCDWGGGGWDGPAEGWEDGDWGCLEWSERVKDCWEGPGGGARGR